MTIMQTMRIWRQTLGRGLASLLTVSWLLVALQPCVASAAMTEPAMDETDVHAMHGMQTGQSDDKHTDHRMPMQEPISEPISKLAAQPCCCCDEDSDAGLPCASPTCTMQGLAHQTSDDAAVTSFTSYTPAAVSHRIPTPSLKLAAPPVYDAGYLPLHPTLRFCTLLI